MKISNISPKQMVLIDDRLATGCLAAEISGINAILITHPYQNFKKRPIHESFFNFLRWFEKKILYFF